MRGIIFAGGIVEDIDFAKDYLQENDYIISLDSGLKYSHALGLTPNVIAGDFDSVDGELLKIYEDMGVQIVRFPARKDLTDMEIGIEIASEAGVTKLYIIGALGGRLDHTFGNIYNMFGAINKGMTPIIVSEDAEIHMIAKCTEFKGKVGQVISLVPYTEIVEGVFTEGLSYPLKYENLYKSHSRGISNVFISDKARVCLNSGILLVFLNKKILFKSF